MDSLPLHKTLSEMLGPKMSKMELEYYAHVREQMKEWQDDEPDDGPDVFLCLLAGRT